MPPHTLLKLLKPLAKSRRDPEMLCGIPSNILEGTFMRIVQVAIQKSQKPINAL